MTREPLGSGDRGGSSDRPMASSASSDLDAASRARILDNLARVRSNVEEACRVAGRDVTEVQIVGVTKYVGSSAAMVLAEAGLRDLGESRPQELWHKAEGLQRNGVSVRWHFLGHLQRNKIRRTLPAVHLLHSLDSLRLIHALDAEASAGGTAVDALLEVDLTDTPGRTGFRPDELPGALEAIGIAGGLRVRGLMGMASAPKEGQRAASTARAEFARLRQEAERLRSSHPAGAALTELSMGMSGDYCEAILEGATLVRIGASLWEGVAKP